MRKLQIKLYMALLFISPLCTSFLLSGALAKDFNQLGQSELKQLQKDEFLIFQDQQEGLPWPKITVFTKIEATPLQAMAVFAAYDIQKDYVPNLTKSTPFKSPAPTKVYVEYEMKLPWPIPNNKYIHGHELKTAKDGRDHYQLRWWMEESNSANEVQGEVAFFKKDDQTYMRYESLIVPSSKFARFISGSMLRDVQKTLTAIKQTTHDYLENRPKIIEVYSKIITQSLEGKPAWKNKIESSQSPEIGDSNKDD